jgi:crotonobetainyl-CoA:carnitine CoA-transferase CaiB-like acyl-CoA transferase
MGAPELAKDPRYDTMAKRVAVRDEVRTALEQTLTQKTTAEWLRIFAEAGVLCSPIQDFDQVFTDPQVLRNKMIEEFEHHRAGKVRVVGIPVKLSRTPGKVRTPPPAVGQHTDELLKDLGYSDEEIKEFKRAKVV